MNWENLGTCDAFGKTDLTPKMAKELNIHLPSDFSPTKTRFLHQALTMLASLNDYDQKQVLKEIVMLGVHPSHPSSIKHSRNPFRRIWRTTYPFRSYHYLITYQLEADNTVIVNDIYFDDKAYGAKEKFSTERTMLYTVKRGNGAKYDGVQGREDLELLPEAWKNPQPTANVDTDHAAVNGMLNSLEKAGWLMGVHLDAAYQTDTIKSYTLFHNPTDNGLLDLAECGFDKRKGKKSHNAQHLAAVLKQNQQLGKKTKWVAHSQGVIVFCAALEHYRIHYQGGLHGQQLAVHGTGANIDRLHNVAISLGLTVRKEIRNNPFDPVPNIAAGVDRSASSFVRCAKFSGLVLGDDYAASPHTLPFLGVRTYHQQLLALGDNPKAQRLSRKVEQYIKSIEREYRQL